MPSDILPCGYYFLTEFAATPQDKVNGDFQHDNMQNLPDNPNVQRPNGVALAGQLAKITAYKAQALGHGTPYSLQTAYLYEFQLNQKRHTISRRWIVRNCEPDKQSVSLIHPTEMSRIERWLRVGIGNHPSPPEFHPIQRANSMPSSDDEYRDATCIPELKAHPIETLTYIIALGITSSGAMHHLRRSIFQNGAEISFLHIASNPHSIDSGIKIQDGRHAFCCMPELLGHIQEHAEWLRKMTGAYDLTKGMLALLGELLLIGPQPPNYKLIYDAFKMAARCDDQATNGALTRRGLRTF